MMPTGLKVCKPTSIVVSGSGSSGSIRSDGGVEFSSSESVSLNGVFSADYDNYMIAIRFTDTSDSSTNNLWFRLRASGTDNSTASSYTAQKLQANGTSVSGSRASNNNGVVQLSRDTLRSGSTIHLYGPQLAQPTAVRSVSASSTSSAMITDYALTHNQSTSYDGITLINQGGWKLSGLVTVYGFTQ